MRADLMIRDLLSREPLPERLLSVRLPVQLLSRLDEVSRALRTRKGEVVIAMLNEGLERFGSGKIATQRRSTRRRKRPR